MAAAPRSVADLLSDRFEARHCKAALQHYQAAIQHFQNNEWETAIAKTGKFVEAILKALWAHVGGTIPPAKQFKAERSWTISLRKAHLRIP